MAMQTKENEIFKQMLDWIYANTEAHNQADVARKSGLFEATISRALNGKIKRVKQETLRKVNSAFGNVFNPAWLRGDSDIMLVADLAEDNNNDFFKTVPSVSPSSTDSPTTSSLINATLAAKDETIMSLKRELSTKDDLIAALREQITDHNQLMRATRQQADDLTKKYSDLLQAHNTLLHRINVNIEHFQDSQLSIAAETMGEYGKPSNKK